MSLDLKGKKRGIGFKFAFKGIFQVFKTERNFKIHIIAALLVVLLGWYLNLSKIEWLFVTFSICFVLVAEMLNSAIELLIDHLFPNYHPVAGHVKDISAGGVLLATLSAVIVGFIIFLPKIVYFIITL